MNTELIKKKTITEKLAHRDRAVELYRKAAELIKEAYDACNRAAPRKFGAASNQELDILNYFGDDSEREIREFAEATRKKIDAAVWRDLLETSGLGEFMDRTARDAFNKQLYENPPVCTVETVTATMMQNAANAGEIFERGVVEAFRKLSKKYRTNKPFKLGEKIILSNAMTLYGKWLSWNFHRNAKDDLWDIERAIRIIDKADAVTRGGGIVAEIERASSDGKLEAENAYFRVKLFKNGNIHVWMKKEEITRELNRIIARQCKNTVASENKC